ncbi:MAG TPA: succinate dehydrogenase, cytochrome b556 subunit [Candidatus Azoamicus sp.]
MKTRRMHLNLFLIDFPITAITSIIHRITGIILFLSLPFFLYFFYLSIESHSSFVIARALFSKFYIKLTFYLFIFSFIYHFITGLKHIIMDVGFFEEKNSSRIFAISSLILILFLIFLSIFI